MPIRIPQVEPDVQPSGGYEIHTDVNQAEIMRDMIASAEIVADRPQESLISIQPSIAPRSYSSSVATLETARHLSPTYPIGDQLIGRVSELENRLHLAGEYLAESAILRCRRCRGYPAFSERCRGMARCVARSWAEEAVQLIGLTRFKSLHNESEFCTIHHPVGHEERHFEHPF